MSFLNICFHPKLYWQSIHRALHYFQTKFCRVLSQELQIKLNSYFNCSLVSKYFFPISSSFYVSLLSVLHYKTGKILMYKIDRCQIARD